MMPNFIPLAVALVVALEPTAGAQGGERVEVQECIARLEALAHDASVPASERVTRLVQAFEESSLAVQKAAGELLARVPLDAPAIKVLANVCTDAATAWREHEELLLRTLGSTLTNMDELVAAADAVKQKNELQKLALQRVRPAMAVIEVLVQRDDEQSVAAVGALLPWTWCTRQTCVLDHLTEVRSKTALTSIADYAMMLDARYRLADERLRKIERSRCPKAPDHWSGSTVEWQRTWKALRDSELARTRTARAEFEQDQRGLYQRLAAAGLAAPSSNKAAGWKKWVNRKAK